MYLLLQRMFTMLTFLNKVVSFNINIKGQMQRNWAYFDYKLK